MHILAPNNIQQKYPYSPEQLRRDNPGTSFPDTPTAELLASWSVFPVEQIPTPEYDASIKRVIESDPVLKDGKWTQTWTVLDLTAEEIAQMQAAKVQEVQLQRQYAYQQEADPLFFKAQRGEASMQEWLDKVNEIRARYPQP